jgi:hypothetical protein
MLSEVRGNQPAEGSQILAAVPSDVRRLCDGLITRPRKKTLITKEKEEKMGQINTMKTNSKRKKNLRLATWNVRSLYRPGGLRITINELRKFKKQ